MTGTLASLDTQGGASLPQPVVRLVNGGDGIATHDRAYVGGISHPQFDAIRDMKPQIWLFRYKRGFTNTSGPHSGYSYDKRRGYVHPAHFVGGAQSGRHVGGGGHTTRNGGAIPDRPTEWTLTDDHRYDAVFEPELWFLNSQTNPYAWPIVPLATATGIEHTTIGQSGQSGNDTGTYPDAQSRAFCGSTRTKGTQVQWFAFAVVVDDPADSRCKIIGPLSEPLRAAIWPKVQVGYGACPITADKGRKIRLRHA
jgi:hypothetical protein